MSVSHMDKVKRRTPEAIPAVSLQPSFIFLRDARKYNRLARALGTLCIGSGSGAYRAVRLQGISC